MLVRERNASVFNHPFVTMGFDLVFAQNSPLVVQLLPWHCDGFPAGMRNTYAITGLGLAFRVTKRALPKSFAPQYPLFAAIPS